MRKSLLLILFLGLSLAFSQKKWPVQEHVKVLNGQNVKYTSKLKGFVHLNFTMGYHHQIGGPIIIKMLEDITAKYGLTMTSFNGDNGA